MRMKALPDWAQRWLRHPAVIAELKANGSVRVVAGRLILSDGAARQIENGAGWTGRYWCPVWWEHAHRWRLAAWWCRRKHEEA